MLKSDIEMRKLGQSDFFGESSIQHLINPAKPETADESVETITYCDMLTLKVGRRGRSLTHSLTHSVVGEVTCSYQHGVGRGLPSLPSTPPPSPLPVKL